MFRIIYWKLCSSFQFFDDILKNTWRFLKKCNEYFVRTTLSDSRKNHSNRKIALVISDDKLESVQRNLLNYLNRKWDDNGYKEEGKNILLMLRRKKDNRKYNQQSNNMTIKASHFFFTRTSSHTFKKLFCYVLKGVGWESAISGTWISDATVIFTNAKCRYAKVACDSKGKQIILHE